MSERRTRLVFPLAILVVYAWFFPWLPGLRSPNELSRLYQARAIVEDHSLSVNAQLARHGPIGDLSVRDGRFYPNKAPGLSFLGAAVYAAVRAVGGGPPSEAAAILWLRLALCVAPGAIAAELLRRILARHFEPALAFAGAATYALGTIAWPYSVLFMSHGPTAAAIVACWWAVERRSWVAAGLLAGVAVLLEYTSAIALPGLAVYAILIERGAAPAAPSAGSGGDGGHDAARRRRASAPLLGMALGLLPSIALLAAYHQLAFGSPLDTGYRHLVNPAFTRFHARGFMGVGWPSLRALAGSLFDPARGLFAWAPFLALGIPGLWALWTARRSLAILCAIEVAAYLGFTASFTYEAWGWTVGPRHITTACAFLAPPALASAAWLRERGWGFLAAALALVGVAKLALTVAVCPYLPEELTNPAVQLVLPLAREGLRSPTLVELAAHAHAAWTVLPWFALLAAVALAACSTLAAAAGASRAVPIAAAWLAALVLLEASARVPSRDGFERTRAFMAAQLELERAVR